MTKDWQYLLRETAKFYRISQEKVLRKRGHLRAKSTFYWLVFKSGLDLVNTSIAIGFERNAIVNFISRTAKKEDNKFRDKSAEEYILNKSK